VALEEETGLEEPGRRGQLRGAMSMVRPLMMLTMSGLRQGKPSRTRALPIQRGVMRDEAMTAALPVCM
jgi:hypothetical protein